MRTPSSAPPAAVALLAILSGALLACAGATRASEVPDQAGEMQTHLEFLGYEVSRKEDAILAMHEVKPSFQIRKVNGGTIFISYWQTNVYARAHRTEFLELVNDFNASATTATFYIDADGDLGFSAWFNGDYEKMRFAQFVERWNRDWDDSIQRDFERAQKFLE